MNQLDHDTDTLDCWCKPSLYVPCPECGPRLHAEIHTDGFKSIRTGVCWRCDGGKHRGLLFSDRTTALMAEGVVVVHNYEETC